MAAACIDLLNVQRAGGPRREGLADLLSASSKCGGDKETGERAHCHASVASHHLTSSRDE